MNRKEFIKTSVAAGLGIPFFSMLLQSCGEGELLYPDFEVNFSGKVIIVGAGAAGITAGYILNRYNIDFEIIEAAPVYGGRLKRTDDFADFPIDLGAEWIHEDPSILARLLSDSNQNASVEVIPYSPESIYSFSGGKLRKYNVGSNFYSEFKFKHSSWFGFFEDHMIPDIIDKIVLNSPVNEIFHAEDGVIVRTANGERYDADKVLVTVPITILQNGFINFIPSLPTEKIDAINSIGMPDGIKVFIEFSERFYPDLLFPTDVISGLQSQQRLYYNAAFRKDSERYILGLFTVGEEATPYASLASDEETIQYVLAELDEIFDGKASETYVKHVIQNWSKEPFIQGSYGISYQESEITTAQKLREPVDGRIYFAGEATGGEKAATVPGAAESAYQVLESLLKG